MSLLFISGFITACIPALILGVNNGITVLGIIAMAYSGTKILRGRA